ncbi:MAG: hypothetical protein V8T87_01735 [Victivallales bacterium]
MKITMSAWPILFVSHELNSENDDGFRLREIIQELETSQECKVIPSFSYEDACEIFFPRRSGSGHCRLGHPGRGQHGKDAPGRTRRNSAQTQQDNPDSADDRQARNGKACR